MCKAVKVPFEPAIGFASLKIDLAIIWGHYIIGFSLESTSVYI